MPEPSRSLALAGQQFGGQTVLGSEGCSEAPSFCPYLQKEEGFLASATYVLLEWYRVLLGYMLDKH